VKRWRKPLRSAAMAGMACLCVRFATLEPDRAARH